jgi:putative oxidoreductase
MGPTRAEDSGLLLLRLTLGVLILLHGLAKLTGDIGGIQGMLQQIGLPAALAYGVYIGEIIAPLLLIAGWFARVAAGVIAINMVFALLLAHRGEFFTLTQQGGWALELQGMFLLTAVALALTGPGNFSINQR